MKICVVKTSSMGDVIHTLPALTDAKRMIPELSIDWVVEEPFAEIPHWHSAVDRVIPIAVRRWRKGLHKMQTWREWQAYKQRLQACRYDTVIDAQGLFKSAFFATRLALGQKHGYDRHSAREGISACFYDKKWHITYQQHAVERIRQLFAHALNYPLPDTLGDYGIACRFQQPIAEISPNPTAYLIAVHATTRDDKHWPADYWRQLFVRLADYPIDIHLPWGNAREHARATQLAQGLARVKVLPKLTLNQLAYCLAGATAVVSVDTGLSHLTAALDTPNVILYGATDPKLIGAYGKQQHYLTANGMANISPERVLNALLPFFA